MFAAALIAALTLSASGVPDETGAAALRAAISYDLLLNGMIGSGNGLASLWWNAGRRDLSDHHIRNLSCRPDRRTYSCSFTLFRDGGVVVSVLGDPAPDRLRCNAVFERDPQSATAWRVRHYPPAPHRSEHTKTSMTCDVSSN
jgi:hypothetical protein